MGKRYIDADKLKKHYAWWKGGTREMTMDEAKSDFDTIIDLQPTVEPTASTCLGCNCPKMEKLEADPTKHGRWIVCDDLYKTIDGRVFDGYRECSACGEMYPYFPEHNYCPNCGAKMDEVEK